MTICRFKAQALTPIHVGAGLEIDPLEFALYENSLIRFNPTEVMNGLQAAEIRRFEELLDRADLKAIQSFLRGHIDPSREGWTPPAFTVSIHLDDTAMQHPRVKALLGRTLDFETVVKACNRFYWGRMLAEADKFDGRASNGSGWQTLHRLFPRGREPQPDAPTFIIDPENRYWRQGQKQRILLRIGRYSHFGVPLRRRAAGRVQCLGQEPHP
jgi:hypothetical protein